MSLPALALSATARCKAVQARAATVRRTGASLHQVRRVMHKDMPGLTTSTLSGEELQVIGFFIEYVTGSPRDSPFSRFQRCWSE